MHLWLACLVLALARPACAAAAQGGDPRPHASPPAREVSLASGSLQEQPAAPKPARAEEYEPPDRGFFPFLGTIVSGSGLAAGGGYRYEEIGWTLLGAEASAMWSVRAYQLYRARFGLISHTGRTLGLRQADAGVASMFNDAAVKRPGTALFLEGRYRSYPRQPYYGAGEQASRADVSSFKLRGPAVDLVGQWQITRSFGISGRAGVLGSAIDPRRGDSERPSVDERFDPALVPGFLDPPRYVVFGGGAAFDRRDNPRAPTRGFFAGGTAWRFEAGGRRFDFTRVTLDARAYLAPGRLPGAIALRLLLSADRTAAESLVPFFLLQTLGGGETLRSYASHRWRERALAHATVEYRWHLNPLVEFAPFVDLASLGNRVGSLSLEGPLYSYGIGVRGHWRSRTLGRLDWAYGPEGHKLVLSTGPIF